MNIVDTTGITQKPTVVAPSKEGLMLPTPGYIKNIYRILMFLDSVWMWAIEPRCPDIPVKTLHNVDLILGSCVLIIYAFCNTFGFKCPDNTPYTPTQPQPTAQDL